MTSTSDTDVPDTLTDAERSALRIDGALDDPDWQPRRAHLAEARNELRKAAGEIAALRAYQGGAASTQDIGKIATTLGLFASCIKSGESWSQTCETANREAHEALTRIGLPLKYWLDWAKANSGVEGKMQTLELEERVKAFNSISLPGQPMGVHMGTSYLVNDLWREVQKLRERLKEYGEIGNGR